MEATHVSIRRARPLLGTFVEIAVTDGSPDAAEAAVEAAFSAVAAVHRLMSFHEADSDVSRLNRGAASDAVRVHDWTYQVLEAARDLHGRSAGRFDISVAPALQRLGLLPRVPGLLSAPSSCLRAGQSHVGTAVASPRLPSGRLRPSEPAIGPAKGGTRWTGYGEVGIYALVAQTPGEGASPLALNRKSELMERPPHPDPLPASGERETAGARGRHDRIQLLPQNRVRFADRSVKIDLGGIAKGFAVDRAVEALRRHGVAEGLVNAGGDLRGFGPRSHGVDVRDPRLPARPLCRVALCNAALASSAGQFDPAGSLDARACAVIDPATARPARSIIGATVCAPCCVIADALTKIVMTAGEAAAPILEHYGADALFVSAHGVVHMTANWKNEVRLAA
jgi:thiamine biosynthesis lipoprotein ApbE